jgi:hypothetical protein
MTTTETNLVVTLGNVLALGGEASVDLLLQRAASVSGGTVGQEYLDHEGRVLGKEAARIHARAAREAVAADPTTAIAVVRDTGLLTLSGRANVLDQVIGDIGDDEKAAKLLTDSKEGMLTREQTIELLSARGGLPSTLALIVPDDVLEEAIQLNLQGVGAGQRNFLLLEWVLIIRDRPGFEKFLKRAGLRDVIIRAIRFVHGNQGARIADVEDAYGIDFEQLGWSELLGFSTLGEQGAPSDDDEDEWEARIIDRAEDEIEGDSSEDVDEAAVEAARIKHAEDMNNRSVAPSKAARHAEEDASALD